MIIPPGFGWLSNIRQGEAIHVQLFELRLFGRTSGLVRPGGMQNAYGIPNTACFMHPFCMWLVVFSIPYPGVHRGLPSFQSKRMCTCWMRPIHYPLLIIGGYVPPNHCIVQLIDWILSVFFRTALAAYLHEALSPVWPNCDLALSSREEQ